MCSPDALFEGSMTQSPSAGVAESGVMNSDPEGSTWCKSGVNKVNCSKIGSNTGSPPTQLIMSYKRPERVWACVEGELQKTHVDRLQHSEQKWMKSKIQRKGNCIHTLISQLTTLFPVRRPCSILGDKSRQIGFLHACICKRTMISHIHVKEVISQTGVIDIYNVTEQIHKLMFIFNFSHLCVSAVDF